MADISKADAARIDCPILVSGSLSEELIFISGPLHGLLARQHYEILALLNEHWNERDAKRVQNRKRTLGLDK